MLPAHHQLCVVDDPHGEDEGHEREVGDQGVLALEQALGQMDQEERPDEENAAQHASTGGKVPLGLEGEERQVDGDGGSDASCHDDIVLPDLRRVDEERDDAHGGDQLDREDAVEHLDEGAPELAKVWKFVNDVSFLTKETQTGKLERVLSCLSSVCYSPQLKLTIVATSSMRHENKLTNSVTRSWEISQFWEI